MYNSNAYINFNFCNLTIIFILTVRGCGDICEYIYRVYGIPSYMAATHTVRCVCKCYDFCIFIYDLCIATTMATI